MHGLGWQWGEYGGEKANGPLGGATGGDDLCEMAYDKFLRELDVRHKGACAL